MILRVILGFLASMAVVAAPVPVLAQDRPSACDKDGYPEPPFFDTTTIPVVAEVRKRVQVANMIYGKSVPLLVLDTRGEMSCILAFNESRPIHAWVESKHLKPKTETYLPGDWLGTWTSQASKPPGKLTLYTPDAFKAVVSAPKDDKDKALFDGLEASAYPVTAQSVGLVGEKTVPIRFGQALLISRFADFAEARGAMLLLDEAKARNRPRKPEDCTLVLFRISAVQAWMFSYGVCGGDRGASFDGTYVRTP